MKLESQPPANGILLKNIWGDCKRYQIVCSCGQDNHDHDVWVESSSVGVEVQILVKVKTNFWSRSRWSHIWQLLTQGYVECETSIELNQQQAMNYATVLHHAVEDITQFKESK